MLGGSKIAIANWLGENSLSRWPCVNRNLRGTGFTPARILFPPAGRCVNRNLREQDAQASLIGSLGLGVLANKLCSTRKSTSDSKISTLIALLLIFKLQKRVSGGFLGC